MAAQKNDPCPNCQSTKVRWRKRRWYDGPLNFIETMLSGAGQIRTHEGMSAMGRSYLDAQDMNQRSIQETRKEMGRRTADRFWRCPDCKQHGEFRADARR